MKKFLNVFLVIVVILSLFATVAFATETEGTSEESFELTEEQLQQLLSGSGYEEEYVEPEYFEAKVIDSGETITEEGTIIQKCQVKILEGEKKGQTMEALAILGYEGYEESMSANFAKSESVYVTFVEETGEDGTTVIQVPYIVEVNRLYAYLALAVIVVVLLLAVSLLRGLETLGLIIYNALVITLGIVLMYYNELNQILSLSTILILLILGDALILGKFKKETIVVIISSLISTIIGFAGMIAINMFLKLQGFVGYFDLSALIMIIPSIGITIDVARRSVEKAKAGKDFKSTVKDVFEKLPSKYNMVMLVWAGFFIENAVSMQSYLLENEYPFNFMNFGSIAIELSKLATMILVPVIVIPVSILITNEILKIKKTIGAAIENK